MTAGSAQTGRLLQVTLAVAVGLALVGYLAGIRPPRPLPVPPPELSPPPSGAVVPGQPYGALRDRRFGPNSRVSSDLTVFQRGFPPIGADRRASTAAEKTAALEDRAGRRASAGAPPVIPHAIDELSS